MYCDLEVEVNGQETFFLHKEVLSTFSSKFRKLFSKSTTKSNAHKVIFHDFPGGPKAFELILQYCYNGGKIEINPSNLFLLHSAAIFMEIHDTDQSADLISQTLNFLDSINYWTWFELLDCLKQCQEMLSYMDSSYSVQEFIDLFVRRLETTYFSSPYTCSSASSSTIQFSFDLTSIDSSRRYKSSQITSWFRDLEFLNIILFKKIVKAMILQKLEHETICSFLIHYQKVKFSGSLQGKEKAKILEIVIDSLSSLNGIFIAFRCLRDLLRFSCHLKISKGCIKRLESLIGSRIDEASLDDLLLPAPHDKKYAYDVNLVLRLLNIFLSERSKHEFAQRLEKVARLMDLYLTEVAADPHLKLSKFTAVALALPDFARKLHDRFYDSVDMYLTAHDYICEEEKTELCSALDFDKLSEECLIHLAHNEKFPATAVFTALASVQSKLEISVKDIRHVKLHGNSVLNFDDKGNQANKYRHECRFLHVNKLYFGEEDGPLGVEMTKVKKIREAQIKAENFVKTNDIHFPSTKSLPSLCS